MSETLHTFLSCFMAFKSLPKSSNGLKHVDIASNVRKLKSIFVGEKVCTAYVDSASCLQKKYAIDNPVLMYLSAIDPIARGHSVTHSYLINLKPYFETFLNDITGDYAAEIRNYIIDNQLPQPLENERLDSWWNKVF